MLPKYSKTQNEIIVNVLEKKHYESLIHECPKSIFLTAQTVLEACVHLVQDDFGSGFCINPKGLILTCFHCISSENENFDPKAIFLLIFPNGELAEARVIEGDKELDLALLEIIKPTRIYPFLEISRNVLPKKGEKVFCIGHPCYDDLETKKKNKKKNYPPFFFSEGKIEGYKSKNEDKDLGNLIHSCWTYWGHSGAPIMDYDGVVVGVHNSWDEKNGNRHAVSIGELNKFINKKFLEY